jgi:hypothetical protein
MSASAHKWDEAVKRLEQAVATQDELHYDEPPDWPLPARHSLGAVLLEAGRAKAAEAVFRADLEKNPENGWSLCGLVAALKAQKKSTTEVQARLEKSWSKADVKLTSSRY